jgi:hypothetical protein
VCKNKRINDSSVMRKHLSAEGMFHRKKKKGKAARYKASASKTEPILEIYFCHLEYVFPIESIF